MERSPEGGVRAHRAARSLEPALEALPERDREILRMRFEEGLTQTQIADKIGISQMHVSRLIRKSLAQCAISLLEPAFHSFSRPAHLTPRLGRVPRSHFRATLSRTSHVADEVTQR